MLFENELGLVVNEIILPALAITNEIFKRSITDMPRMEKLESIKILY